MCIRAGLGTVTRAGADGAALPVAGAGVRLPAGTAHAEITYRS
jgi:uncharacterized protein YjlB